MAFCLTRKGVRAKSFSVGLAGPVNKIARTSSSSSRGGGRILYIFWMGDSKATILAFIFRMPEATFTKAQVCLTRATNIFSTKVRFLRTFGTAPSQRLFERASLGTFPLLMSPRHPLQILLQP